MKEFLAWLQFIFIAIPRGLILTVWSYMKGETSDEIIDCLVNKWKKEELV